MANLPVPVPRTFSVSETETAAYLNSIRDALNFTLAVPVLAVYQGTTQSLTNNTWTAINMDNTVLDTYGGHSNVTNNSRYTAQVAGIYVVQGTVAFASNNANMRGARIHKNGSLPYPGFTTFNQAATSDVCSYTTPLTPISLVVGDYVEVYGNQLSGGALSTVARTDVACSMTVFWLHN